MQIYTHICTIRFFIRMQAISSCIIFHHDTVSVQINTDDPLEQIIRQNGHHCNMIGESYHTIFRLNGQHNIPADNEYTSTYNTLRTHKPAKRIRIRPVYAVKQVYTYIRRRTASTAVVTGPGGPCTFAQPRKGTETATVRSTRSPCVVLSTL